MRHPLPLALFALTFTATLSPAVEPSDLKPGLVATYKEPAASGQPLAVTRLEPTVALRLGKGEAPHPRMKSLATAKWSGYVNVTRPGKYTFSVEVEDGRFSLTVGGQAVLSNAGGPGAGDSKTVEITLAGGVQNFEANFQATGGSPRVELWWKGPGFVREPLPHQFLGHLPKDRPAALASDLELEHGRFLFEELACVKCHKPEATDRLAKGLADRAGPNLTEIGKRAYAGWIDSWLADPMKHRPNTTMPKMFTEDDRGRAERYAVTRYLVSLSGAPLASYKPPLVASNDVRLSFERGRVLYSVAGCAACHEQTRTQVKPKGEEDEREPLKPEDYHYSLGTSGPTAKYDLGAIGSKTRPEALAAFLREPFKNHPAGRMPDMKLNQQEANDLARYLCRVNDEVTEPAMPTEPKLKPTELARDVYRAYYGIRAADEMRAFNPLPAEKQWNELGAKLVVLRGCTECHAIEQAGKAIPPAQLAPALGEVRAAGAKGCLGEKPDPAKQPSYKLGSKERTAMAAFLKTGLDGAGTPAPTHAARVALRRFNCLNCHSRDGEGGIPTELADQMRLLEKAENADDVRPPLLTGVGHKSRASWLKSVLTGGGRARPWMQLRMPQYGDANVGFLTEALAAVEGTTPDDAIHKVPLSNQQIALGRQIVGKAGLGCISCHDIGGVANTGTRGPDLATINQRVRYEWYERWMHQPLRMAPGTRMPQAFVDGKSTLSAVLGGDPKKQAEAMWAYLSLGPGLPLPEGLEPPKGLIVAVRERAEVLRTFMPEAGNKALAVGYPGGVNLAFAADECRLAYSWAGNFLDASPVWNNRGGAPAKLLGPKFWTSPAGHPWGLTANADIPPDFLARAKNPAFGMPLPLEPARVYNGPLAVHFDGYSLDRDSRPTFRYHLVENAKDAVLKVAETPAPIKSASATGFTRRFVVESPGGYTSWLLAGQTNKQPRAVTAVGAPVPGLDLESAMPRIAAAGTRVVLPQDGDRAVVLEAVGLPDGANWQFVPGPGGGWLAVLRLPATREPLKGTFDLVLWALPKDDESLLKDLAAK